MEQAPGNSIWLFFTFLCVLAEHNVLATLQDHLLTIHISSEKQIQKIFQCKGCIISPQWHLVGPASR